MRFDYPVLVLINTNVINGHKKQVDSVRLILRKVAQRCSLEALGSRRGLLTSVGDASPLSVPTVSSPPALGFPLSCPHPLLGGSSP